MLKVKEKRIRRSSPDALEYLKEKSKVQQHFKEEGLKLKKQEHNILLQQLQQQQQQQQEILELIHQQQQSQMIVTPNKLSAK